MILEKKKEHSHEVTPKMSPRRKTMPAVPIARTTPPGTGTKEVDLSVSRVDGTKSENRVGPGSALVQDADATSTGAEPGDTGQDVLNKFAGKGVIWLHGYIRSNKLNPDLLDIVDAKDLRKKLSALAVDKK